MNEVMYGPKLGSMCWVSAGQAVGLAGKLSAQWYVLISFSIGVINGDVICVVIGNVIGFVIGFTISAITAAASGINDVHCQGKGQR